MKRDLDVVLLVLGHGSSKHPDSSRSVKKHTEALRAQGGFSEVHCAFLKEEPYIEEGVLDSMQADKICIVPDFLAEGYFTRQVIPKKLNLIEKGSSVKYCPPVGTHPLMVDLINSAAISVLDNWKVEETSLLVIGHGSTKNFCSKQTLKSHLANLRKQTDWKQVADLLRSKWWYYRFY